MSILPGPKLNKKTIVFLLVFTGFLIFWILINVFHTFSNLNSARSVFTNTYGVIAFIGGIFAIYISKLWGGYKSLIGRAIFIFGLSLLAQEFGQLMYAYYIYVRHIPVPYPSLGDIGYFGSDLLILFAIYTLFRASGSKFSLTTLTNKLQTIIIPIIILSISYTIFLKEHTRLRFS